LKAALLDSSAIVAMLDHAQQSHASVVASLRAWKGALVTVEAVIAESCHLLRRVHGAPETILQNVVGNILQIPFRPFCRGARNRTASPQVPGSTD